MVRKKVEGNEEQRRAAGRGARRTGEEPSARHVTTGSSKQRSHLPDHHSLTHEEKVSPLHQGKQQWRPGEAVEVAPRPSPEDRFGPRDRPGYTPAHEEVFRALVEAEETRSGEAAYLDDIARRAALPQERTRLLLHDLVSVHRLVTELQRVDSPDQGPRFETKPRR